MRDQIEVLPEINISAVTEQIQAWYTKQQASIPAKIENAIEDTPDAAANKTRERTIGYLGVLNEIATSELVFIEQTRLLKTKLEELIKAEQERPFFQSDKAKIASLNAYLTKVSALIVAQSRSSYFNCYQNDQIGTVETNLYQFFSSDGFKAYLDAVINLSVEYEKINPLLPDIILPSEQSAYKFSPSPLALGGSSMQRITRYKDLISVLVAAKNKLNSSVSSKNYSLVCNKGTDDKLALERVEEYVKEYHLRLAYLGDIKNAEAKIGELKRPVGFTKKNTHYLQRLVLREILDLKLSTGLQKEEHYHGYIQTLLARAYPELFEMNDNRFDVNKKAKNYDDIYKALGYNLEQGIAPDIEIRIDLKKLNKNILAQLYETRIDTAYSTRKNPLWLVLKSIKTIDEQFSAIDKIEAYRDIASSCYNREISSGDEKYEVVLIVAQSAYSVAASYPEAVNAARAAFTPQKQFQRHGKEELIGAGRFGWWVVNKDPSNQPLHQLLEAPHLDSHVDTVRKLNEQVVLNSQKNNGETSETVVAAQIEYSPLATAELAETPGELEADVVALKNQVRELNEKLKASKANEYALKFYNSTLSLKQERLQKQLEKQSMQYNELATEVKQLSDMVSKEEATLRIESSEIQESNLLINLTARLATLFEAFRQHMTSPFVSKKMTEPRSFESQSAAFFKSANSSILSSQPTSAFSDIKTTFKKKFEGTNSSGIKRLITLMDKVTLDDKDSLLFILMKMQQISQERADLTLPKLGIMNRGRRRDAQTFYDAMKNIDLSTEAGKQSAIGTLNSILSESSNNPSLRTEP